MKLLIIIVSGLVNSVTSKNVSMYNVPILQHLQIQVFRFSQLALVTPFHSLIVTQE
jgi:hypothetical protein